MDFQIQKTKNLVHLQKWVVLIQECQSSGMTNSDWCKMKNISEATYYRNLKKVREYALQQQSGDDETAPVLVKVPNPLACDPVPEVSAASSIVIHHNGSVIEISNGVSPDLLKALVQAL